MPLRDAVGDQAGDGGAAGVVGAEDLAEEDPQGDQRGEDPVVPGGLDLLEAPARGTPPRGRRRRGGRPLEELPSEGVDLLAKTSVEGGAHHTGSEPVKEAGASPSQSGRQTLPIPFSGN